MTVAQISQPRVSEVVWHDYIPHGPPRISLIFLNRR